MPKAEMPSYFTLSTDEVNLLSDFFTSVSYEYNEHVIDIESMGRNTNMVKFIIKEIVILDNNEKTFDILNEYEFNLQ